MKLRRRCMQTLGVSVKQLRRKLFELGARILHAQGSKPRDMALVMLSMGSAMDVRRGGGGGGNGGGGGGGGALGDAEGTNGNALTRGVRVAAGVAGHGDVLQQEAVIAAARDRAIRTGSVRQDLALNLPPRLELPDGEERPYGAQTSLHLRDPLQESEIYQKCVRPPPNRTVFDSESPPPYRSQSALLEPPDRIVRCHSAGSSLLKVFRKFPSPGGGTSTSAVVAPAPPKKSTLSSYSESSSNLSNLSSLTVVPCETDESRQEQYHHRQRRV
ncbi:hypothetical protein KPH14_009860 [Odynerus spinipes]|uniref:Uncharacterized protein n=1 Tax=Odynerus spinipes TaxID=1348599 RepID=A0AAD9RWI0_9HYME|nr:hypothetical protein KPH14_009860 [Odynerus spinipes]